MRCLCRGIFGDTCTLEQVQTELLGYSDFSLHCLALNNAPKFSQFLLDPEHLMDSAKCRALAELLPKLKVSRCPVMAAVSGPRHLRAWPAQAEQDARTCMHMEFSCTHKL